MADRRNKGSQTDQLDRHCRHFGHHHSERTLCSTITNLGAKPSKGIGHAEIGVVQIELHVIMLVPRNDQMPTKCCASQL